MIELRFFARESRGNKMKSVLNEEEAMYNEK